MKISFITSNPGKLAEAREFLTPLGFQVENVSLDLIEIQASQEEVARAKALEARKTIKGDLVVEDTGFYIDAFNGFLGVLAAPVIKQIHREGFIHIMRGVENRKAYFKAVVSYFPANTLAPLLFTGECHGEVSSQATSSRPRLTYDSFFIPQGETRTFGEMSIEEKNKYSHRIKAFQKLAQYLKESEQK